MRPQTRDALVDRLADFDRLVEVGVGRRPAVAAALAARGHDVTATDVHERETPEGVRFVRDDVADPDPAVYRDADCVYALNLPPELHRPVAAVARRHAAACLFTTLGGDGPAVPVDPETLPGETLFRVRDGPGVPGSRTGDETPPRRARGAPDANARTTTDTDA